jgi:flagellar hook assembly protein FlgD
LPTVLVVTPLRPSRTALIAVGLALALVVGGAATAVQTVRAGEAAALKAVFIVGPAGPQTAGDLEDAEELAQLAESYGMDVRRVFHPHATWEAVMANIQGANLVYYTGHGYGWPSPYTKEMTESRQNGIGINSYDGSGLNEYKYYGANPIRNNWVLAPNAIVFLNHGCYTAGNGEPGMPIPSWDVARQRVDNFANGFLAAGAEAVFAYPYGSFNRTLTELLSSDLSVEDIFRIPGWQPSPSFGWVGWDPRKFDSVRTPGATNFLDPHQTQGFARAVTGDLELTAAEWRDGGGDVPAPTLSDFSVVESGPAFAQPTTAFFTPNGDGVTDVLNMNFTVDTEAFVDLDVRNSSGNVVRTLTSWSAGGPGSATWDGKNTGGNKVADGRYTVTATPRNRAGTSGNSESLNVDVLTVMRSPQASPSMLYPADGDGFAATTSLSVTLGAPATFWWKVADAGGTVVRTHLNGANTPAGDHTWQWDGRDSDGDYVPDGTYYSIMTTSTAAGTYFHSVAIDVKAFRLTTKYAPPFVRGGKTKVFVYSAEPLTGKPKVKVFLPGLAPKTYKTTVKASGGWYAVVNFPTTAQAGTMTMRVVGTDQGAQVQQTEYSFELR